MNPEKTPRQHLLESLKDRLETLRKRPDPASADYLEPLSLRRLTEVTIQLSWGGPGDGFKLYLNEAGKVESGLYYWEDWGTYEQEGLEEKELRQVADYFEPLLTP
jgi:hypothetical protein